MEFKLAFWKKESGNMMSHSKGLTEEEVKALQELKVGDRMILWFNNPKDETKPTYSLKVFSVRKNEF